MKKLLVLIVFTVAATFNVKAVEYDVKDFYDRVSEDYLTKKMGVYYGNPLENIIVGEGDMYVIIHNPTELSLIVMEQEARSFCKKKSVKHNYTSYFMRLFGRYTAYYSCEMENKIDQYTLSDEEKICIEDMVYQSSNNSCIDLNKKNVDIINAIELQNINEAKHKTFDFIYSVRTKFYDKIEAVEQIAEDKRQNKRDKKLNKQIQKHVAICKKYTFNQGSEEFNQCILKLIERDQEKTKEIIRIIDKIE